MNARRPRSTAGALITVLVVSHNAGCSDSNAPVTLEADVQPLFDLNCAIAGCHVGQAAAADLVLSAGESQRNLIGVASSQVTGATRVTPGDPDASLLLRVLREPVPLEPPHPDQFLVERMPRDTSPLSDAEISTIEAWIAGGAVER